MHGHYKIASKVKSHSYTRVSEVHTTNPLVSCVEGTCFTSAFVHVSVFIVSFFFGKHKMQKENQGSVLVPHQFGHVRVQCSVPVQDGGTGGAAASSSELSTTRC